MGRGFLIGSLKKEESMKEQDGGVKWFNTVFYPTRKTGRAIRYEDGILPRLHERRITFFTPWGPRYDWEKRGVAIHDDDKEVKTLNFLASLLDNFRENMLNKEFCWIFLGADLYGTRINKLPDEVVANYFNNLALWLDRVLPVAEFNLWSKYNDEAEEYRQKARVSLGNLVSDSIIFRAGQTARVMGRGSSAKEYLVERLAEAMLVEKLYKPVKISCVGREKDTQVDGELPVLYLLPENLRKPWM